MERLILMQDLKSRTAKNLAYARQLFLKTEKELNYRQQDNAWSALECVEHLNLYAAFYHPEIANRIRSSKHPNSDTFKSGYLGNYFANSMIPNEKMKKINTFKSMNPLGSNLDKKVIEAFIQSQEVLLQLLEDALKVNWTKTKTSISISSLIKLRLGDTLRVLIYHNDRHILQAEKAIKNSTLSETTKIAIG